MRPASYVVCLPEIITFFFVVFVLICRYSNLILNLFSLMVDANIPDIALEPDKTVKKVCAVLTFGPKISEREQNEQ